MCSNNEIKTAIALRYSPEEGDAAPRIIASGKGTVAEEILSRARECNIPLQEDSYLADSLSNIDLGDYVPAELYRAVAEVLAFVYGLEKRRAIDQINFD